MGQQQQQQQQQQWNIGEASCTLPDGRTVTLGGSERAAIPEALFDPASVRNGLGVKFGGGVEFGEGGRGGGGGGGLSDGKVGAADLVLAAVDAADAQQMALSGGVVVGGSGSGGVGSSASDTKRRLLRGVVCAGGGSLLRGLPERLATDLDAALAPNSTSSGTINNSNSRNLLAGEVHVAAPEGRQFAAWKGGCVVAEYAPTAPEGWVFKADFDEMGPSAVLDFCFS